MIARSGAIIAVEAIMKLCRHPEETQPLKALPTAFMSEAQAAAAHAVREPTISQCGMFHRFLRKPGKNHSRKIGIKASQIGRYDTVMGNTF